MAAATAALAFSAVAVYGGPAPSRVVVESPRGSWIYPLSEDRSFSVDGFIGATAIVIESGGARIVDSPCAHKTCVSSGTVRRAGDWAACLPNGVFVRVEGGVDDGGFDAVAR